MPRVIKRALLTLTLSIGLLGVSGAAAFADPGNSASGIDRYNANPGRQESQSHTQCSGAGAFGFFGKDNSLAGGANGQQTGLNNSSLCGNRQGNLP